MVPVMSRARAMAGVNALSRIVAIFATLLAHNIKKEVGIDIYIYIHMHIYIYTHIHQP